MTHVHLWDAQKLPISSRNGHFRPFKNRSGLINSFGLINSDSKNYPTFSIKYGCNQLISISNNIFYFNIFHPEFIRPNEFIRPDRFFDDLKLGINGRLGRFWMLFMHWNLPKNQFKSSTEISNFTMSDHNFAAWRPPGKIHVGVAENFRYAWS